MARLQGEVLQLEWM